MNRKTKLLLSVMIVSLSTLIVTLKGQHNASVKTEPVAVQVLVKSTGVNTENFIEKQSVSINFEINNAIKERKQKMVEIGSILDKKEWFIAYKNLLNEYSNIIDPPETIYDCFTEEELDLLFHVVQAEIGDEYYSFEQKVNVVSVIFNRLKHEQFPNTLSEILIASQFQPISNGKYREVEVSEDMVLACEYAFIMGGIRWMGVCFLIVIIH